jgi:sulfane dehydrogenase subunit SoxC
MKTPGDPMGSQLYGMPSPFEKDVIKNVPTNLPQYLSASGRTPLQDLDGIITPNGLFYERHTVGRGWHGDPRPDVKNPACKAGC